MTYSKITTNDWDNLSSRQALNPDMVVNLQLLSDSGEESPYLCIFVSTDTSMHFLCEISESESQFEITDPNVAGLELKIIKNHFILGRERQNYYDLRCTGNHHKEEFTNMVNEICELIFSKNFSIHRSILTVFRRSTSFWGRQKSIFLSEEMQRGLFGELYVLNKLLKLGVNDAITKWKGPLKSKHDFYFDNISIEVKTTLSSRHKLVINGLEQLEKEDDRGLLIVSFKLMSSENGTSITNFVDEIKQILNDRPDYIEEFNVLLQEYGYNPSDDDLYNCFIVVESSVFPVNEGFPVFTNQQLKEPVPSRISKINYSLDMEGLYHFKLEEDKFTEYLNIVI
ncbi:PD-(D/E)XK motif protein [Neobacillus vireti]|uniref:PD-(D/E)XK motif protein n=1 Tax=Neobacillus vireti TaxID=220686 RepID=UPI00300058B7